MAMRVDMVVEMMLNAVVDIVLSFGVVFLVAGLFGSSCNLIYFMSSAVSYDLQGIGGGTVLNAGASYTGPIRWIQVVNDAVLSTVASASGAIANPTRLQTITLPAGLGIGGRFSSVAVTSGVVIVYFE